MSTLVLHVRLHDGRYHGKGDWPPSPARLFQALVAGAGLGGPIGDAEKQALEWLEKQNPPIIAAPLERHPGQHVLFYVPNNDSDKIDGDPVRMAAIRTEQKVFQPYLFDADVPFLYAWPLPRGASEDDLRRVRSICCLAERLYQLGRGVDMAWAWGEVLDDNEFNELLTKYSGRVLRPSAGNSTTTLLSPSSGSLESLLRRYRAYGERFRYLRDGRAVKGILRNPPKAHFRRASYDTSPSRQLYELRTPEHAFAPWPLERALALVVQVRDAAVARLKTGMPSRKTDIERVLVGRKPDGTNDGPPEDRVRIIPLPSIGHVHADHRIRRILVEVPGTCPLRAQDVRWAFSGLKLTDSTTLIPTEDDFLSYYVQPSRTWRTVTPAALPEDTARRLHSNVVHAHERNEQQSRAASAVLRALRHIRLQAKVRSLRVQRQPFWAQDARAEDFSGGPRFHRGRLWHVEVSFDIPVEGPIVLGDGRFLGLGVMAPFASTPGIHILRAESCVAESVSPEDLAQALRRAVFARVQAQSGDPLSTFFTGHEVTGQPARAPYSSHLAYAYDPVRSRFLIVAPHVLDRRLPRPEEEKQLELLDRSLQGFSELRAGRAGVLRLRRVEIEVQTDPLFATSRFWESLTPYRVTRHAAVGSPAAALECDLTTELQRRGFPKATIQVIHVRGIPGKGLEGTVRLEFGSAQQGPLFLGRSRYLGGGVFTSRVGEY